MNEVLYLPLEKRWFEMIKSGEKTEEYRELTPYWISRLMCWCDPVNYCPPRYRRITSQDAQDLAKKRKLLFYGYMSGNIVLKQPKIVEFSLGYPKRDDSERRFRMRVKQVVLRIPKKEWVYEWPDSHKLHICIDLGEMIEE